MTQVTGTIERIEAREVPGYGTFYDLIVDGQKYGNGKFRPRDVNEGDMVTFEYDTVQKGKYTNRNIKARSMRIAEAGAKPTPAPAATAAPARQPYVPFDERQEIISKQAALNTSIALGNLAVAAGAVLVPKSAKDSDKLTLVHNWILEEAARIYNATTGREWDINPENNVETPKEAAKAHAQRGRKPAVIEDKGADEWGDDFADDDIPF